MEGSKQEDNGGRRKLAKRKTQPPQPKQAEEANMPTKEEPSWARPIKKISEAPSQLTNLMSQMAAQVAQIGSKVNRLEAKVGQLILEMKAKKTQPYAPSIGRRELVSLMEQNNLTLLNESNTPTHRGTSTSRDTTPGLSPVAGTLDISRRNEGTNQLCDGTWRLLRHLIDPLTSKSETNRNKTRTLNNSGGEAVKLVEDLRDKYLKTKKIGEWPGPYRGLSNESPAKSPHIDNLRPISLTSCVGKVMERMVLNRLQRHLDCTKQMPDTMYGFRRHLSTQDVLLQLKEEVMKQATRHSPRAILALDLKGAFDNVSHASIITNLLGTGCGERTYNYVREFLTERRARIKGSVLSPLLFNIALLGLPRALGVIEGLGHALYADDVSLWTTKAGSSGWIQDTLQAAADVVEKYARGYGLRCSPQKSELVVVRPRAPKKHTERGSVKILGLTVQADNKVATSLCGLKHTSEQILHRLRRQVVIIIRKAVKQAIGVPVSASTNKLLEMEIHNTVDELIEGHLSSQRQRLSQTQSGRQVIRKIGWSAAELEEKGKLAGDWQEKIKTKPIPKNINPACHGGRRKELGNGEDVVYTDVSRDQGTTRAVAVVTTNKKMLTSVSVEVKDVEEAEEVAIALALTLPGRTRVVTDSQQAYRSFQLRVLKNKRPPEEPIDVVWVRSHYAVEGNELAHKQARALTYRATGRGRGEFRLDQKHPPPLSPIALTLSPVERWENLLSSPALEGRSALVGH
ncbi:hypothetical protein HPB47_023608 [Ixodes persulcatus]|uniref:Uncharacterized protein n=1 Tax=Ixodes persulcatus TaxID=34615 RepID=A0AC60Q6X0_IXOPE|nr:hypothetical protein HPB47_023608 [Ixodes persulcatus]